MYKRLYTFLNNNNIICNLQFGFRPQYSTFHVLINVTEDIRKALDGGNIGWGVLWTCKKQLIRYTTFDTVSKIELLCNSRGYKWLVQILSI